MGREDQFHSHPTRNQMLSIPVFCLLVMDPGRWWMRTLPLTSAAISSANRLSVAMPPPPLSLPPSEKWFSTSRFSADFLVSYERGSELKHGYVRFRAGGKSKGCPLPRLRFPLGVSPCQDRYFHEYTLRRFRRRCHTCSHVCFLREECSVGKEEGGKPKMWALISP